MPQWGIEPHERASFAGWRPSFWPPSADAPQVYVVERLDFGGCLPWFVGRGLAPPGAVTAGTAGGYRIRPYGGNGMVFIPQS